MDSADYYFRMNKTKKMEHEQLQAKRKKPCSKCGNSEVIRIPGAGISFYYCPTCSKDAQERAEAQYKDLPPLKKEK